MYMYMYIHIYMHVKKVFYACVCGNACGRCSHLENAYHGRLSDVGGDVVERLLQRLLDIFQDGLQSQVTERAQRQTADQRVLVVAAAQVTR